MKLEGLFYTYKEMGVVEKDGVKFKKFVKVPRVRSKQRAALSQALFTAFLAAVAFKGLGWLLDRLKDAG